MQETYRRNSSELAINIIDFQGMIIIFMIGEYGREQCHAFVHFARNIP